MIFNFNNEIKDEIGKLIFAFLKLCFEVVVELNCLRCGPWRRNVGRAIPQKRKECHMFILLSSNGNLFYIGNNLIVITEPMFSLLQRNFMILLTQLSQFMLDTPSLIQQRYSALLR